MKRVLLFLMLAGMACPMVGMDFYRECELRELFLEESQINDTGGIPGFTSEISVLLEGESDWDQSLSAVFERIEKNKSAYKEQKNEEKILAQEKKLKNEEKLKRHVGYLKEKKNLKAVVASVVDLQVNSHQKDSFDRWKSLDELLFEQECWSKVKPFLQLFKRIHNSQEEEYIEKIRKGFRKRIMKKKGNKVDPFYELIKTDYILCYKERKRKEKKMIMSVKELTKSFGLISNKEFQHRKECFERKVMLDFTAGNDKKNYDI